MAVTPDVFPVVASAEGLPGPAQGQWTYAAYAALPDDGRRYEVVEGVLYVTPAPGTHHQAVSTLLVTYLTQHVQFAGHGLVFSAPCDVELGPHDVVQPDVIVVLNERRPIIRPDRILGAPDLVVEILSPGTAGHDRRGKQDAYARAGITEYWIVDPNARTIEVLRLKGGPYRSLGVFGRAARLPSAVVPDLVVRVEQFFPAEQPAG